jgi:Leucine-rich repeat (LRR) protein
MNLWQTQVKDLKALRMMPLRQLSLAYTEVSDLNPLRGRPLQSLTVAYSPVENLAPLTGAPLVHLHLSGTRAHDLAPLQKMPLQTLHLDSTPVRDLSALAGLPLKELRLDGCTELRDLTPLAKCTDLEVLTLPRDHGEIDFLRNLPKLKKLSYRYDTDPSKLEPASQFWRTRSLARRR